MEKGLNYLSNEKQYVMEMQQKNGEPFLQIEINQRMSHRLDMPSNLINLNVSRLKPSLYGIETKPNVT